MVQIRCLSCTKLVELPAQFCPHCKNPLSGLAPQAAVNKPAYDPHQKFASSNADFPVKSKPPSSLKPLGGGNNKFGHGKKELENPNEVPTTFEKKVTDGVPTWAYFLGGIALVWAGFFIIPILLDPTAREKNQPVFSSKKNEAKPSPAAELLMPVHVPTIRTDIDEAAAIHNAELEIELNAERNLE